MIRHLLFIETQDSLDNLSLISSLIHCSLIAYIPHYPFLVYTLKFSLFLKYKINKSCNKIYNWDLTIIIKVLYMGLGRGGNH